MPLIHFIYRKIDPDRLIPVKTWLAIVSLAVLAGLLFSTAIIFIISGERSIQRSASVYKKLGAATALADELDSLLQNAELYEVHLREFITSGDSTALRAMLQNQTGIYHNQTKLTRLILVDSNLQVLKQVVVRTDSAFAGTARLLEIKKLQGTEAALEGLAFIKTLNHDLGYLSRQIMRNRADLFYYHIGEYVGKNRHNIRTALIPITVLSGLVFTLLLYVVIRSVRRILTDRRAYRQLYEEQKKLTDYLNNLMNVLPIGVHSLDPEGLIIDMNSTELGWLGYTAEEVIGKKHITEIIPTVSKEHFAELFATFKKQGYYKNFEIEFTAKDGSPIPVLFNAIAVYDKAGNISHSITVAFNYTERKQLEDTLVAAREAAENANQLKQLFMTNMSHEIRTPLNGILGFAHLLGRAELPVNLKEFVQGIQISGANLLTIVNDILDFEKIQSGLLRIEQVEFDLPGLLHSVFTMLRPSAEEKQLTLHLEVDPDIPLPLVGDPMRLTQILINLLSNAIKFTPNGMVTLRVRALTGSTLEDKVRIRFEVVDTGIGIPVAEQERIFERFMQASSSTSRKYGGTGLGLALVKMLVELQKGTIVVVSEEGVGSVFTVEIPFRLLIAGAKPANGPPASQDGFPNLSKCHVLLVEDNPINRRIAELNLREFGLQVMLAENGYEAIKILRDFPETFDLVLMDIQMPGLDGHSATQLIRSELGLMNLPIIAMTAHVLAGEQEKALASGMDGYLTKPVQHHELLLTLLRYLPGFWDVEALRSFTQHNQESFQEICQLFIRQFPVEVDQLKDALQKADFPAVATAAHHLRSTTSYSGFQASLGKILLEIESAAMEAKPDTVLLAQLLADLVRDGQYAHALLKRELARK